MCKQTSTHVRSVTVLCLNSTTVTGLSVTEGKRHKTFQKGSKNITCVYKLWEVYVFVITCVNLIANHRMYLMFWIECKKKSLFYVYIHSKCDSYLLARYTTCEVLKKWWSDLNAEYCIQIWIRRHCHHFHFHRFAFSMLKSSNLKCWVWFDVICWNLQVN